jgi:hypothetical protein
MAIVMDVHARLDLFAATSTPCDARRRIRRRSRSVAALVRFRAPGRLKLIGEQTRLRG